MWRRDGDGGGRSLLAVDICGRGRIKGETEGSGSGYCSVQKSRVLSEVSTALKISSGRRAIIAWPTSLSKSEFPYTDLKRA
jgi:hypothetical protein